MSDLHDDPDFREWEANVRADLVPKLESSGSVVSLVPTGETDIKFAVELGLSIMMDKPIIAVVVPGANVPEKLARVADHILEADLDSPAGRASLQERLMPIIEALPE